MVKVALIGAGKMGLSHLSILGAHPEVEIVGVCDTSKLVTDVLSKYSGFECFSDYLQMIRKAKPEAVFVAVPTRFHTSVIKPLIAEGIHVFSEKPFGLNPEESAPLVTLAKQHHVVNQVGYHNRFVGTFQEVKKLVESNSIGDIYHFQAEAYGPVVLKRKSETWRSDPKEGGGCLMDYASHVVDLVNYLVSPVTEVYASIVKPVFSTNVDDSVYALLKAGSVNGILSVNWSDETYRKMSTSITLMGTKGKIISDASELKVYFKDSDCPAGYTKGWNVKYITELAERVDFYLRGEEYSAQVDYFIQTVLGKKANTINTFESAWNTDKAISMIREKSEI
ncbi:MAG TPA: oxidoreductase [Sphingobacteriaceae bacterium]|nr:oxidoreductase [Sphingobacteriaceae bacterium]